MKCPWCKTARRGNSAKLRDQSPADTAMNQQYRKRSCHCGNAWTTVEVLESDLLQLRKLAHCAVMAGAKA